MASALTPHITNVDIFLSHCHRRQHPSKASLIDASDKSEYLYYIVKGSASVIIENEGREIIVAYLNEGDFFGEMGLFDDSYDKRTFRVRAKSACEIAGIGYTKFHELRESHPEFLFSLSRQMAHRLRHTTRKVSDLAFLNVTDRVARTLLVLCREPDAITHPDGMQIKITRQEIGRIVGCSREMVGRALKTLEKQGLVSATGKTMVVYGTR